MDERFHNKYKGYVDLLLAVFCHKSFPEPRENMGEFLYNQGLEKGFLIVTQNPEAKNLVSLTR